LSTAGTLSTKGTYTFGNFSNKGNLDNYANLNTWLTKFPTIVLLTSPHTIGFSIIFKENSRSPFNIGRGSNPRPTDRETSTPAGSQLSICWRVTLFFEILAYFQMNREYPTPKLWVRKIVLKLCWKVLLKHHETKRNYKIRFKKVLNEHAFSTFEPEKQTVFQYFAKILGFGKVIHIFNWHICKMSFLLWNKRNTSIKCKICT